MQKPKIEYTEHIWGDKDFDWDSLHNAEIDLWMYCRRWGRVGLNTKEKWGTLRAYTTCSFITTYSPWHSLRYPGHAYIRYGKLMRWIDYEILSRIFNYTGLRFLILKWQLRCYRKGYERIVKKYPHIRNEILCEADLPELLEGL